MNNIQRDFKNKASLRRQQHGRGATATPAVIRPQRDGRRRQEDLPEDDMDLELDPQEPWEEPEGGPLRTQGLRFADGGMARRIDATRPAGTAAPRGRRQRPEPAQPQAFDRMAATRPTGMPAPGGLRRQGPQQEAPSADPRRRRIAATRPANTMYLADGGSAKKALRRNNYKRGGPVDGPGGPTEDKIPAMLSDGEYVLPADTVDAVGEENLDALREATHEPARRGEGPTVDRQGRLGLRTGGAVDTAEDLRRRSQFNTRRAQMDMRAHNISPQDIVREMNQARGPQASAAPQPAPQSGPRRVFQPGQSQASAPVDRTRTGANSAAPAARGGGLRQLAGRAGVAAVPIMAGYETFDEARNDPGALDERAQRYGLRYDQSEAGSLQRRTVEGVATAENAANIATFGQFDRNREAAEAGPGEFLREMSGLNNLRRLGGTIRDWWQGGEEDPEAGADAEGQALSDEELAAQQPGEGEPVTNDFDPETVTQRTPLGTTPQGRAYGIGPGTGQGLRDAPLLVQGLSQDPGERMNEVRDARERSLLRQMTDTRATQIRRDTNQGQNFTPAQARAAAVDRVMRNAQDLRRQGRHAEANQMTRRAEAMLQAPVDEQQGADLQGELENMQGEVDGLRANALGEQQAQAEQLRAHTGLMRQQQGAQDSERDSRERAFERFQSITDRIFGNVPEEERDAAKADFEEFAYGTGAYVDTDGNNAMEAITMLDNPGDQARAATELRAMMNLQRAIEEHTGQRINVLDSLSTEGRPATWDDVVNRGLPWMDYMRSALLGREVLDTKSGSAVSERKVSGRRNQLFGLLGSLGDDERERILQMLQR